MHRSVVNQVLKNPPDTADFLQLRDIRAQLDRSDWDVLKWSHDRLSLVTYDGFDICWHPMYRSSVSFPYFEGPGRAHTFAGMNRPILHRKELMVGADYPNRQCWEERTKREEDAGLYEDTRRIGGFRYWELLCLRTGNNELRCPCPTCVQSRQALRLPEVCP